MQKLCLHLKKNRVSYLLIFSGSLLFFCIYGFRVLDFTYTDWLMCGGDLSQHYLGWKLFRTSEWQPMIGMMNSGGYPFSQSVIFTDSIPLFAILFKIFSAFLPSSFQYFGLYGFLSFLLQGLIASFILKRYLKRDLDLFLGSFLFFLVPAFLRRIFWHTSLSSHWLILLALLAFVWIDRTDFPLWKKNLYWSILGILCSFIHLYFLPMCGLIAAISCLKDFTRTRRFPASFSPLIFFCIFSFLSIWFLGGFSSEMYEGAPGLGYYSFNLLGFLNPENWSSLLPALTYYADGQYEGFAYLGAGVIFLGIASACLLLYHTIKDKSLWSKKRILRPNILFACLLFLLSVIMAASNEVSFGRFLLFQFPVPEYIISIWSFFRSSGRLIWPAIYLIMIFFLCITVRYTRRQTSAILLSFCLLLQLYDLHSILQEKYTEFQTEASYVSPLADPLWENLTTISSLKHIVFTDKDNLSQEELYAFADFSSHHSMTINDFYFARALAYPVKEVAEDFLLHADDSCIYIFSSSSTLNCLNYPLHYYEADHFIVGLKTPLSGFTECSKEHLKTWSYKFAGNHLTNGEDRDGVRYLQPDGISFGPYISVPAGKYLVCVFGRNLKDASYECYGGGGSIPFSVSNFMSSDNLVTFSFETATPVEDLEIKIQNTSASELTIRKILLEQN